MPTALLVRPTDELPPPPKKTLRIPELEALEADLTEGALCYYLLGDRRQARRMLVKRDTEIRPLLIGLRAMRKSPPARDLLAS